MKVASCWWSGDDGGCSLKVLGELRTKKQKNKNQKQKLHKYTKRKKKIFSETAKSEGERLLS